MINWKDHIVTMGLVKEVLKKYDTEELWPHRLPSVAATEDQLLEVELHIGHSLEQQYRDFLKFANGWKGFMQTIDLFGTEELLGNTKMEYARTMLDVLESEGVLQEIGFSIEEVQPIAATTVDKDIFLLTLPSSSLPGMIIWLAGEEIDRFPNFEEYFLAMIDYNRYAIESLKQNLS